METTKFVDAFVRTDDPRKPDPRYVRNYHKSGNDFARFGTAAGGVIAEKGYLPVLTLSGTDNEDGTATITVTVTQWNTNAVANAYLVRLWLSATALGAAADLGEIAATTGRIVTEHVTDAYLDVATNAAGVAVLTFTGADQTGVIHGAILGKVSALSLVITGNS